MCRNVRLLFKFAPAVSGNEIGAAALQLVRKVSGFNEPSQAGAAAGNAAVDEMAGSCPRLPGALPAGGAGG